MLNLFLLLHLISHLAWFFWICILSLFETLFLPISVVFENSIQYYYGHFLGASDLTQNQRKYSHF